MRANNILSATSDLVRRDSNLPGLELLLDPTRLLESLNGHLDAGRVEDIRLDYLRYKPGMNCLGRYQLRVAGSTITAHAKTHGEDAAKKMSKSSERPVVDTVLGPGRVALKQRNVIFSIFPNDAKLASLQSLGNESSRQRLLGRVFGSESNWSHSYVDSVLNYKPERRYVVRLVRENGEAVLAKFYSRSGYARAHSISRKLNRSRNDLYPETVGRSKKYAVVAYHWQPGTTLRQLNIDGQISLPDLTAAVESLAEFHASDGHGLSMPAREGQTGKLHALAGQLGFMLPQLEQRAKSVSHNLSRWWLDQKTVSKPVHGDFYDKQVVINHGKASLIDLDSACLGNPLLDMGNYIAHLEILARSPGVSNVDVGQQKELLIKAYEQLTTGIPMDQLNRYIALSLFALIHHPFRDWVKDWPVQTERLLSRVEALYEA